MSKSRIYPGLSLFFANRSGKYNWLDNNDRPFLSLIRTKKSGKKEYDDLFLNTNEVTVTENDDNVVLTIPKDLSRPLFNILHK